LLRTYAEDAFEVLSQKIWRVALAEVPPDEDEFIKVWASVVEYCNTYGTPATEKQRDGFSSYPDPHVKHPSITTSFHPYLNKLFHVKDQ